MSAIPPESGRDLLPHEIDALLALERAVGADSIRRESDTAFRSRCPAHDGEGENLVVYLNPEGVIFKCWSEGCTHDNVREALGLTRASLRPGDVYDCSLRAYATEKKLTAEFLASCHVSELTWQQGPVVSMAYLDRGGREITIRYRVRLDGDDRFRWKKGRQSMCAYGLWKLDMATRSGRLTLVEGESDVQTLWSHEEPGLGIPGANNARQCLPEIEQYLSANPQVVPYVVMETDAAGMHFVRSFQDTSFRDRVRVIRLGSFKDVNGLHCSTEDFNTSWLRAQAEAISIDECLNLPQTLAALAPELP